LGGCRTRAARSQNDLRKEEIIKMTNSVTDTLSDLARVLETRKPANGGDPETSYVARLLAKGPDAFLKKIGEEATEVVMAAKDVDAGGDKIKLVGEVADLWFHSMIALAHYELTPADVVAELTRRIGLSGLDEKALRKVAERAKEENFK
jgi:phosphoribosyl-ATP pyrophosphohydrolase